MKRSLLPILILFFVFAGCSSINSVIFFLPRKISNSVDNIMKPSLVEQAFEGKLSISEANKAIHAYCQTCHIHRNILPDHCLDTKPGLYSRAPYKNASECRICHYIAKDFWSSQFHRVTRFPDEVSEDKYKEFEQEYFKEVNKPEKGEAIKGKVSRK